jgi:hypothetical protein
LNLSQIVFCEWVVVPSRRQPVTYQPEQVDEHEVTMCDVVSTNPDLQCLQYKDLLSITIDFSDTHFNASLLSKSINAAKTPQHWLKMSTVKHIMPDIKRKPDGWYLPISHLPIFANWLSPEIFYPAMVILQAAYVHIERNNMKVGRNQLLARITELETELGEARDETSKLRYDAAYKDIETDVLKPRYVYSLIRKYKPDANGQLPVYGYQVVRFQKRRSSVLQNILRRNYPDHVTIAGPVESNKEVKMVKKLVERMPKLLMVAYNHLHPAEGCTEEMIIDHFNAVSMDEL